MSNDSFEREITKEKLKRGLIDTASPEEDGAEEFPDLEEYREEQKNRRRRNIRYGIVFGILLLLSALAVRYFLMNHTFEEYSVEWERVTPSSEGNLAGYERFGKNLLKYTRDGASCLDQKGNVLWTLSFEVKAPICSVNGDYAVIADQQGNSVYILNQSGLRREATTILPILRVSISEHGVVAVLSEDSAASYVTFFKEDGSDLDWGIKTAMSGNGYLMDVSLSPDGTQVMLSDIYVKEGLLKNRVVFYNFSEYGKSYPDRLVGGFDEFGDSFCPRVKFLDDHHAVAFASGKVGFFNLENVTSPTMSTVDVPGEIRGVACSRQYVALVTDNPDGETAQKLWIYRRDGTLSGTCDFDVEWQKVEIDAEKILLYTVNTCFICNPKGRVRYEGAFDFSFAKLLSGAGYNTVTAVSSDTMRELHFK